MTPFISENIQDVSAVKATPNVGSQIKPTDEIVTGLEFGAGNEWSNEQKLLGRLLTETGVTVDWVKEEGRMAMQPVYTPENGRETVVAAVDERRVQVQEMYDLANEHLPEYKRELVVGLAKYGAGLGIDSGEVETLLSDRIANISEAEILDPITQGINDRPRGAAEFTSPDDVFRIGYDATKRDADNLNITEEQLVRRNSLHELMHAASARAQAEGTSRPVRGGLGVMAHVEGKQPGFRSWTGSQLLDEGAQEHIRWKHLDGTPPGYEQSVMFWEMAIEQDPAIEKLRFEAKFLNKNRGLLIGHIENIFGPGAVEAIEDMFDEPDAHRLVNYPAWKEGVTNMIQIYDDDPAKKEELTLAARQRARKTLDRVQSEAFKSRGWDYSDEQLILAKQNGAVKADEIAQALQRAA